jgi:nucleoside diphosphate kinase
MKFLLVIFLIFILIGPVIRFALRFLVMNKIVKEQKRYYEQNSPQNRKEGEIRVDNATPNKSQKTKDSEGQYIDFEEVK